MAGKSLGEPETEAFRRDGILFPLRAVEPDAIAECLSTFESIEARYAGRFPPALNVKSHLLVPQLWDLVHARRIVDPVEDLLGPDILCWAASFFAKSPGDGQHVPWHQDGTYWGLTAPAAVTVWLAFTPSTVENGCLRVVPGSHHGQFPHRDANRSGNMLPVGEELSVEVNEADAVDVVLAPGEMSIHHVLLAHASETNRSSGRRIGLAIRYIDGRVGQRDGRRNSATLVRGRDHGTFDLERAPESAFDPRALERQRQILRAFADNVSAAKTSESRQHPPGEPPSG